MKGSFINVLLRAASTLIIITILCFLLQKMISDDPAVDYLELNGISAENTSWMNYQQQYLQVRKDLNLDIPSFYITIFSSASPSHKYSTVSFETLSDRIKHKGYGKIEMESLISMILDIEQDFTQQKKKLPRSLTNLLNPASINQDFSLMISPLLEESELNAITRSKLSEAYNAMKTSTSGIYFPQVRWNGINNQFHQWIRTILQGNLGVSILDKRNVTSKILSALKWTFSLIIFALGLVLVLSVLVAMVLFQHRNKWWTKVIWNILYALRSTPIFWLATIAILFFTTSEYGTWTNLFPSPMAIITSEDTSVLIQFMQNLQLLVLPIFCITLIDLPYTVRLIYYALLKENDKPYATHLMAKGLNKNKVFMNHLLPNAMVPIITLISNSIPSALAGSLIIEVIFNIPGIGRLLYQSIQFNDYNVIYGILIVISLATTVSFIAADFLYRFFSPKVKLTTDKA